MKISYKPLWKTLIGKNMSKKDLRLQAHLTTNHIANMGKYGLLRLRYLKEHRPSLFNRLTLNGKLYAHLLGGADELL